MKKTVTAALIIATAVISLVIGREVIHSFAAPSAGETTSQVEEGVKKAAAQLRATLPKKIDAMTALVDVTSAGVVMTYCYKVDSDNYDVPHDLMFLVQTSITEEVCESYDTKQAMKTSAVYAYSFSDSDSKLLGTFIIRDGDCA
jgi:hypothetical protein